VQLLFLQQAVKGSIEEFQVSVDGEVAASGVRRASKAATEAHGTPASRLLKKMRAVAVLNCGARRRHTAELHDQDCSALLQPALLSPHMNACLKASAAASAYLLLPPPYCCYHPTVYCCTADMSTTRLANGLWSLLLAWGVLLSSLLLRTARSWRFLRSPVRCAAPLVVTHAGLLAHIHAA